MIVYDGPGPAAVRRGEFHPFNGARSRTRAIPYPGFDDGPDPWRGQYRRPAEVESRPGPPGSAAWKEALANAPPGRVLVGPMTEAEPVYGAGTAAIEAAEALGHAVVAIEAAGIAGPFSFAGSAVARVVVWEPDRDAEKLWTSFGSRGGRAGVALPLIPGWTGEETFLARFFSAAAAHGARFVVPFPVSGDGGSRAAIHADFARIHPGDADAFFDAIHHRDWEEGMRRARERFAAVAVRARLPTRVPALAGRADFAANARLIEIFETEAERVEEPRASRLLAAARRLEDFGRDVAEIAREGNLRLLWAPDSPEGRTAAASLGGETAGP